MIDPTVQFDAIRGESQRSPNAIIRVYRGDLGAVAAEVFAFSEGSDRIIITTQVTGPMWGRRDIARDEEAWRRYIA